MHETKVNTKNADVTSSVAKNDLSPLEQDYGLFYDRTIRTADGLKIGSLGAGQLMRDMNRMHQVVAGLGVVLRIVGGNSVLEDEFDPAEPNSAPPLSKTAVSMLTAMAASLCEGMCESMDRRAFRYNSEVKA